MRRVSEGVMNQPEMIPAKLENNPHHVPGAEEVMERVLKWDKSIGEWAFDGMKEGYSPKVEPRRSREVHFPAPDSAYEPFLSDDESWQAALQASVKPGKFLNTSPIIRPEKDINHDDDATSEDCPQSTAPPEETAEEPEPPEERKNDAVEEVPVKTAEDVVTCSVQKVSTKIAFLRCAGLPRVPDETNLAKEPDTKAAEIDVPVATMTPAGSSEGTVTCTPFV